MDKKIAKQNKKVLFVFQKLFHLDVCHQYRETSISCRL